MEETKGRLEHLTPEQQESLETFKVKLKELGLYEPEKHNDQLLLRFLRARQFHLQKAIEMWTKFQHWRKEFGVDTVFIAVTVDSSRL